LAHEYEKAQPFLPKKAPRRASGPLGFSHIYKRNQNENPSYGEHLSIDE